MGVTIAPRLLVLACVSTLAVAAVADAGNRLHAIQTAPAPCNSYGGGTRMAVSPDGAHGYEYDRGCDSFRITVSSRDAGTGQLTVVQTVDVADPFCSLDDHGMTVSPDGNHVYIHRGPRMYIFERSIGSGVISEVGILSLGNGATGPFRISPDGAHLYFVKRGSTYLDPDAVEVFARDATTGALTAAGEVVVGPVVYDIVVSPDGAHLYMFTAPELYFLDEAVRTYNRDPGTGWLTPLGAAEMSLGLGYGRLAVSGDGSNVYLAVNASGSSRVLTFARDAGMGLVTQIDDDEVSLHLLTSYSGGDAIALAGEQAYVIVEGRLVVFDRGGLDGSLSFKEQHVDQVTGVPDGLAYIHGIAIPPDLAQVYTIGEGTVTFGRDGATGALTFLRNAEADGWPFLVGSPDGKHLYRWCTHTVARFDRDGSTGLLTQTASIDLGSIGIGDAYGVRMAPDGRHIYVDDREGDVAILHRDSVTGELDNVATYASVLPTTISPDGKNAYWVGYTRVVGALTRDVTTGLLTSFGGYSLGTAFEESDYIDAKDVVVSPDGSHVYVGARHATHPRMDAGIAAFVRDPHTGALTFASRQRVNGGGGGPFDDIWRLAPSADGTLLYAMVAGPTNRPTGEPEAGGVAAYSRTAGSGALTFRHALTTGATLAWGGTLEATPDGTLLYALSGRGLQVLRSDPATGALGFVETVPDVPDTTGSQALSPDGRHLYVLLASGDVMVLGNRPVCSATPASGCAAATASTLKIIARVGAGDTVAWKWKAAGAIDTGDPLAATEYAICVYDGSAAAQPVLSSGIPPGRVCGTKPCWTATATGYKYANRTGDPDGITTLRMVTGASGAASIALKGKGASLPPLALPYAVPITAQLQGSHGACWQASYTAATGNAGLLRARQ